MRLGEIRAITVITVIPVNLYFYDKLYTLIHIQLIISPTRNKLGKSRIINETHFRYSAEFFAEIRAEILTKLILINPYAYLYISLNRLLIFQKLSESRVSTHDIYYC